MTIKEDIKIVFGGDTTPLKKAVTRASAMMSGFKERALSAGRSVSESFGIGAGVAGGGAAAGLAVLTQQLDELLKTSSALNTTVESLHALRFAVGQTSQTTEQQLNTALQRLTRFIGEANNGSEDAQKRFRTLGLSWEYLASLPLDQAFLEVSESIKSIEDPYMRATAAQKIFEDSWRVLLPTLVSGKDALADLIQQAREMPGPTTNAAIAAANFNDSVAKLSTQLQGMTLAVAPVITDFLSFMRAKFTDAGEQAREGMIMEMVKIGDEIRVLEKKLARTGFFALSEEEAEDTRRQIKSLEMVYEDTFKAVEELDEKERRRNERNKKEQEAQKKLIEDLKKNRADMRKIDTGEERRPVAKSPEETALALMEFREGKITAQELGRRTGLPGGVPEGGFGTQANLAGGRRTGLTVEIDPQGLADLPEKLRQALESQEYNVTLHAAVVPTLLVGGDQLAPSSAVEHVTDQVGGQ